MQALSRFDGQNELVYELRARVSSNVAVTATSSTN